jgi:hypothetical protein
MKLRRPPSKPKSLPIVAMHVDLTDIPSAWASYVFWNCELEQG